MKSDRYNIRELVDSVLLCQRIEELASLKFSDNVYNSLKDPSVSFMLSQFDVEAINSRHPCSSLPSL